MALGPLSARDRQEAEHAFLPDHVHPTEQVTGLDDALAARLRIDAAQTLSNTQKAQGRTNLGLGTMAVVSPTGTPDGKKFLRDDNAWAVVPPFLNGDAEDRTSARAINVIYTNATTGWLFVTMKGQRSMSTFELARPIAGPWFVFGHAGADGHLHAAALIPPGWRYRWYSSNATSQTPAAWADMT